MAAGRREHMQPSGVTPAAHRGRRHAEDARGLRQAQPVAIGGFSTSQNLLKSMRRWATRSLYHSTARFAVTGLTVIGCVWRGRPSRALWEALLIAGLAGFGAALWIHAVIGYVDLSHVGPAILGALIFLAGIVLSRRSMTRARAPESRLARPIGRSE